MTRDDRQVVCEPPRPTRVDARVRAHYGTGHRRSVDVGRQRRRRACSPLRRDTAMRAGQGEAQDSARAFACARCGAQVLVFRRCDRGQRYCGRECARPARRESLREAGRRYQRSRAGRFAHARRARRYRQRRGRQQVVTHHGSQALGEPAKVGPDPSVTPRDRRGRAAPAWQCHWCTSACAPWLRRGFLRHERVRGPAGGGIVMVNRPDSDIEIERLQLRFAGARVIAAGGLRRVRSGGGPVRLRQRRREPLLGARAPGGQDGDGLQALCKHRDPLPQDGGGGPSPADRACAMRATRCPGTTRCPSARRASPRCRPSCCAASTACWTPTSSRSALT